MSSMNSRTGQAQDFRVGKHQNHRSAWPITWRFPVAEPPCLSPSSHSLQCLRNRLVPQGRRKCTLLMYIGCQGTVASLLT